MSEPFIGAINMYGFNFAPRSWAFCNGQLMAIAQNTALFSLLGTIYGGDGRTTFALPDLRGRSPMQFGTGAGLSTRHIGARSGSETSTLNSLNLPSHSHAAALSAVAQTTMLASTDQANSDVPTTNSVLGKAVTNFDSTSIYDTNGADGSVAMGGFHTEVGGTVTIGNTGANQAFNNMSPFLAINFSIALLGIYPSRN